MPGRSEGNGCRVYIGNLPKDTRERDLERFFRSFGRLRDILIKPGYGFVEFDDYRDADDAVYEMNGRDLLGERVSVELAKGPKRDRQGGRDGGRKAPWMDKYGPPTRTDYRVIVENLSTRVSWQDLKDLMRREGEVCYADAHKHRRNEGLVEFISRRDMERAVEKYDGYEMNGKAIKLIVDMPKSKSRSRSRSRSRRDSRSNSRSRSRSDRRRRSRSGSRRSRSSRGGNEKTNGNRSASRDERRSGSRDAKRSASRSASRNGDRRSGDRSKSRSRSGSKYSRSRSPHVKNENGDN